MINTIIPHDHRLQPPQEIDQQAPAVELPQVKKQARRRAHTSRPYQERLLNMAEARREIVTALKIHRASTRQQQSTATYQHQEPLQLQPPLQLQRQQEEEQQQVQVVFQDQSQAVEEEEASLLVPPMMSYASFAADDPLRNSPLAHWFAAGTGSGSGYYSSPPILPCDLTVTPPELLPTAMGGFLELPECYQGLECLVHSLPAQPLGLNLSFQGFGVSVDVDGASRDDHDHLFGVPLTQQSSPAASYSPPAMEVATTHAHGSPTALSSTDSEMHPVIIDAPEAALIPVLDDGEMMMRSSTGEEMQGVEWSEATAADVAAWWSKIFESMESEQRAPSNTEHVAAGLPAEWRWLLCDDDVDVGEQGAVMVMEGKPTPPDVLGTMMHVDDGDHSCCYEGRRSDDGEEEITLPCMDDMGDTEGWDGEWFSCS